VSTGLLGVACTYLIFDHSDPETVWQAMSGFAFGASSIALFARVGGGIYTKAADVGADLVGKVEEDLAEDSPDNPATIGTLRFANKTA
jgi:K(+)-stimulated pyrophosphate-energized sodium pump